MTERGPDPTQGEPRRWSRRSALKAGVGAGVGVVVFTGPTITSLGGTPAYALECTFAVEQVLADDRNTDQGNSCVSVQGFGYHAVATLANLPAGYRSVPAGWGSKVCSTDSDPFDLWLYYPSAQNLACSITVEFFLPSDPGTATYTFTYDQTTFGLGEIPDYLGLTSSGPGPDEQAGEESLYWHLPTAQEVQDYSIANPGTVYPPLSQTRYRVKLRCVTEGKEDCFD